MNKIKTGLKLSLFITAFSFILMFPSVSLAKEESVSANEIVVLTNELRSDLNVGSLSVNPLLVIAAENKAKDMFDKGYWSHYSPEGVTPWYFIETTGYYYQAAGENLAKGFSNSESVLKAWISSSAHKENLVSNDFNEVGVSVVKGTLNGKETTIVVQMFGKQKTYLSTLVDNVTKSIKVMVRNDPI